MDMSSLFPADSGALSARAPPHVSFKAGMMNRDETTNLVTADERKGVFQIITSPEDQLMHLQWRALNTSSVDEDLIIFSGAAEMKRVVSCSATARVFVLKWKGVDKRMFFWMQGKDPTADEAHIAQVNTILENGVDNQQVCCSLNAVQLLLWAGLFSCADFCAKSNRDSKPFISLTNQSASYLLRTYLPMQPPLMQRERSTKLWINYQSLRRPRIRPTQMSPCNQQLHPQKIRRRRQQLPLPRRGARPLL